MKILVFSDIHGDKKALKALEKKVKKAEILVCGFYRGHGHRR